MSVNDDANRCQDLIMEAMKALEEERPMRAAFFLGRLQGHVYAIQVATHPGQGEK